MNNEDIKKVHEIYKEYGRIIENSLGEFINHCDCIGAGWYELLENFLRDVNCEFSKAGLLFIPKLDFQQIKEKFGYLRIYVNVSGGTDELDKKVQELLSIYEHESGSVCERCGEPGERRKDSWIMTLCDYCFMKRQTGEY